MKDDIVLPGENFIRVENHQLTTEERIAVLELQMRNTLNVMTAMNKQIGRLIVLMENQDER